MQRYNRGDRLPLSIIVAADFDDRRCREHIRDTYKEHMRARRGKSTHIWIGVTDVSDPDMKNDCDFRYDGRSVSFDKSVYDSFMYRVMAERYRKEPFLVAISDAGTVPEGRIGGNTDVLVMLPVTGGMKGYLDLIGRADRYCTRHKDLTEFREMSMSYDPDNPGDKYCLLELPLLATEALLSIFTGF